jgi:hypothetical protein
MDGKKGTMQCMQISGCWVSIQSRCDKKERSHEIAVRIQQVIPGCGIPKEKARSSSPDCKRPLRSKPFLSCLLSEKSYSFRRLLLKSHNMETGYFSRYSYNARVWTTKESLFDFRIVCMYQSNSHRMDLPKTSYLRFLPNFFDTLPFWLKSDKITLHMTT